MPPHSEFLGGLPGGFSLPQLEGIAALMERMRFAEDRAKRCKEMLEDVRDYQLAKLLTTTIQRNNPTGSDAVATEIPEYVDAKFTLAIGQSAISNAGRGVFLMQDVRVGDLIARIEKPLQCIIADGKETLEVTCDHCFAQCAAGCNFIVCDGCNVLFYCNWMCREAAFEHHHQYECETIDAISKEEVYGSDKVNPIFYKEMRALIRLLSLHREDQIDAGMWDELFKLETNILTQMKNGQYFGWAIYVAEIMLKHNVTSLELVEVIDLVFMIYNNQHEIPKISQRDSMRYLFPIQGSLEAIGACLEPFISLLNHSCDPNTTWLVDGTKLELRAEKDIAPGEELTLGYWRNERDLEPRRQKLLDSWCIDCTCNICMKGHRGPKGKLKTELENLKLSNIDPKNPDPHFRAAIAAIEKLKKAGWSMSIPQMDDLHMTAYTFHVRNNNHQEMLKTWLKIYYAVQPAAQFPYPRVYRLDSLRVLVTLVDAPVFDDPAWEIYPIHLRRLLPPIHSFLRRKLLTESASCYGKESRGGKWDHEVTGDDYTRNGFFEAMGLKIGVPAVYDAAEKRKGDEDCFVEGMNLLLLWAGIERRTREQLLA